MADFLERLKQGIEKGVTTVTVRSKEMLDVSRVMSEIADYERQRKGALVELGKMTCAMIDAGRIDEDALKGGRAAIAKLDEQIAEKQREQARIHADADRAVREASDVRACACGTPVAAGAKFCASCGREHAAPAGAAQA